MAIKTFSVGEVLTASDTNEYLTNSGLVYVTSTTIGSAVSSVTVSNCFSSTYNHYRIVIADVDASTGGNMQFQFSGITGSVYSTAGTFFSFGSATINGFGPAATTIWVIGPTNTETSNFTGDIISPFATKRKSFIGGGVGDTSSYQFQGTCNSTTSATGFAISPSSGTITGGTISVYGYRKA